MDAKKIWRAARESDGGDIEVDGVMVSAEVAAALRLLPAPQDDGRIITFGKAPDRKLVVRDGLAVIEVVREVDPPNPDVRRDP